MPTCRVCKEPITFILTPKRRRHPVDPELITERLVPGSIGNVVLVLENGEVIRGMRAHPIAPEVEIVQGYISHWSTCTHPDQFRKER